MSGSVMQIKMEQIDKRLEKKIFETLLASKRVLHSDDNIHWPELIWHYTNASALEAILNSKTMYATKYDYLNDPSENKLFGMIAKRIAKKKLKDLPKITDDYVLKTPDEYKAAFWHIIIEQDEFFLVHPICVTCFSFSGDLLSQWRAYADNCRGYALGLDILFLQKHSLTEDFPFRLIKVEYDPKKQFRLVETILDSVINEAAQILSEADEENEEKILTYMVRFIQRIVAEFSPMVKHPAYSDEREWRLISFRNDLDVRISNGNFIKFTKINLLNKKNEIPFREIKIGPANSMKIEKEALILFLKKYGLENQVKISESKIPIKNA